MRPKGKLFALVVMFAAVGLITASGAFTTVEADRTADVQTAGDASALLGLETGSSNLIETNSNDEVTITLDSGSNGEGVNTNATTTVNGTDFLNITNNGASTIELNISAAGANGAQVYFVVDNAQYDDGNVNFDTSTTMDDGNYLDSDLITLSEKYAVGGDASDTVVEIGSGDQVKIGLIIVTNDVAPDQSIFENDEVTITAESIDGNPSL